MKKILTMLAAVAMTLGVCATTNVVKAEEEVTGIIYYNVTKLSIPDPQNLQPGAYFMSTEGGLTDPDYMSAKFPDGLEANVQVTGALDTTQSYYGKDDGDVMYNIDGYPVDVIKRDNLFDGCDEGHLFAPADKKDANGEQLWIYYCDYGGAQNVGPYYLYSVKNTTYTANDISVKVMKDFSKATSVQTVTKEDVEVTINVNIDGKIVAYVTKDFTIDSYRNTVDPTTGKADIRIVLEGALEGTSLSVDVSVPVTIPKIEEVEKEQAKVVVTPVTQSPSTGLMTPLLSAMGIGTMAIGACSMLRKKSKK